MREALGGGRVVAAVFLPLVEEPQQRRRLAVGLAEAGNAILARIIGAVRAALAAGADVEEQVPHAIEFALREGHVDIAMDAAFRVARVLAQQLQGFIARDAHPRLHGARVAVADGQRALHGVGEFWRDEGLPRDRLRVLVVIGVGHEALDVGGFKQRLVADAQVYRALTFHSHSPH